MIWKIAITTTMEAEDAVAELLSSVFSTTAASYTDIETGMVTVAIYCEVRPVAVQKRRGLVRAGISRIRSYGLNAGIGRISIARIRREDWAESWKRHFRPIEIGRSLLIKPSWSKRRPAKGQVVVVLDPGLSFGTGQHPTTGFCLQELVRRRRAGEKQSFLDVGTGSGILAISAAKLGYSPVHAFDFDPEAVRVARANSRANGVLKKMRISRDDVSRLPARPARHYDMICANLISTMLIAERRRIVRFLKPGGFLVLAGVLKAEFKHVQQAYESLRLRLIASSSQNEWRSGTFIGSFRSRF